MKKGSFDADTSSGKVKELGAGGISEHGFADELLQASQLLGQMGRITSETALLQEVCKRRHSADCLEALLRSAERTHESALAASTVRKLEEFYEQNGNIEKLAELRKYRHRFPRYCNLPKPRIAGIMDEFTTNCFVPECVYLPLHPERARQQISEFDPEIVFVESAWNGNEGMWKGLIASASEPLTDMLSWCRNAGVPTVFWNKEDPVHFELFLPVARLCDFVFTTDIDCIPIYKKILAHDRVHLLPFAAQPQIHNPIEYFYRKAAFNFAGSYYHRRPQRQSEFATLVEAASKFLPVEIYDRNFGKGLPNFEFPDKYQDLILGRLPFSEIDKAYKGYLFGINTNTVKRSQTMFARRVYELMASNTVVVSNYSRGLRLAFGDLVISSDDKNRIQADLGQLISNAEDLRKFRLLGLRKVFQEHTYAARLAHIRSIVRGTAQVIDLPRIALFATADTASEAQTLVAQFSRQTHGRRHFFLVCKDDSFHSPMPDVSVFYSPEELGSRLVSIRRKYDLFGLLNAKDFYGPNYLTDLILATQYSDADGFGKACYFRLEFGEVKLCSEELRYSFVDRAVLRSSVLDVSYLNAKKLRNMLRSPDSASISGLSILAVDEFNYCRDGSTRRDAATVVSDLAIEFQGIGIGKLYSIARTFRPGKSRTWSPKTPDPVLRAREFNDGSTSGNSSSLMKSLCAEMFCAARDQATNDSKAYLWINEKKRREALNLVDQSNLFFRMSHNLVSASLICEYYDAEGSKLSHEALRVGGQHSLSIPSECAKLRFGLRLVGPGTLSIGDITFGEQIVLPQKIVGTSDTLVLTKDFPFKENDQVFQSTQNRLHPIITEGKQVDVFRIAQKKHCVFEEFGNIDVSTGDIKLLDETLVSGQHSHVFICALDQSIWELMRKRLDYISVTILFHEADLLNFRPLGSCLSVSDEVEVAGEKGETDSSIELWREVFNEGSKSTCLVFASEALQKEAVRVIGASPPASRVLATCDVL